jgi:hypothetical protein
MTATHQDRLEIIADDGFRIITGRDYLYACDYPAGRRGHVYTPVSFVLDVPSYQQKVLVRCKSGPDRGLRFVVTPSNFSYRYIMTPDPVKETATDAEASPAPPRPVKVLDLTSRGRG